ncbi:DUF6587 family protein [Paraburkholderia acidisoli]|uniref:Transmembrane protein n=1 Tax=Paraburkholderia acidisoli TaxID=2571748 RepID=A0A7Z2GLH8_9BURK|nr:DUF6587 family protein [Paraburkholderia acidisoli]QGZ64002.1 hypothetical protein FAZ98_19875 [Paraburkholderia acidisoli]
MSAGLVVQYTVIALLVIASLIQTTRKLAPKSAQRAQAAMAAPLLRPQRGALAQRIGRFLQPKGAPAGHCGDSGGCNTCGTCGPSSPEASNEQPVAFHPPRK